LRSSSSLSQQPAPHAWEDEESCCGCDHDHDHVHVGVLHKHVEVSNGAALMTLIYALLFSVHSLIAGLALGVQNELGSAAMAILVAIISHKFVEALSLAASFVREGVQLETSIYILLVYCCMTPLGILLGGFLQGLHGAADVESLLSGFAAGSFTFLAAHELEGSPRATLSKAMRGALAVGGLACMAGLSAFV